MLRDMLERAETRGRCVLCGPSALLGAGMELECRDCGDKHIVCLACVRLWDIGGRESGKQFGATVIVLHLATCPDGILMERELSDRKDGAGDGFGELQNGLLGGLRAAAAEAKRKRL